MIAYFDCFSGASGDMLLGGLLDAGLSLLELQADLACLDVRGYHLEAERVTRHGLTGTHLRVVVAQGEHPARHLSSVEQIIGASHLPAKVKSSSLKVFRRLAQAEANVHGVPIEEIHFHEIGAVDSLVDIVGFCAALQRLGIEAVYCSSLPLGGGTIQTEHGQLPVPAPATLALLAEARVPTVPGPGEGELVTPTGAALLTEMATFWQPAMAIQATGYGFGTKLFDWPNALRVWLGREQMEVGGASAVARRQPGQAAPSLPVRLPAATDLADQVVEMACNLDDATGEALGYAMERLLAAGALDVWFTPIQMKKNRPATQLSVLARQQDAEAMAAILLGDTPTLGLRYRTVQRCTAGREVYRVDTPWGAVRVKSKILKGRRVSVSPEYDDCARIAAAAGVPLAEVMEAARRAAEAPTGQ